MKYKDGVYTYVRKIVNGIEETLILCPEMEVAKVIVDDISQSMFNIEGTITAIFDGKHMSGSKHYTGEAFDIRIKYYPKEKVKAFVDALKLNLGDDYDVVLHEGSHIHIEYDPK